MPHFNARFTLVGEARMEILDITKRVQEAIQRGPVTTGIAVINTLHTTCAVFVNEFQHALAGDLLALAERLVPERGGYRHDDPRFSGCERGNGHAHLRAMLLGRSIMVTIAHGELVLGRFQSIMFAEFDGGRARDITVDVIGV